MHLYFARTLFAAATILLTATSQASVIPVANFNFSSGSLQSGPSALQVVDPQNKSGFVTDSVFGTQQQVYRFDSNSGHQSQQAGLQLDTSNLVTDAYTIDMVFKLDLLTSGYQRLFDVSARDSDTGAYVRNSFIEIYNTNAFSPTKLVANEYSRLTLTNSGQGLVSAYLNGTWLYNTQTSVLDFDNFAVANPKKLMSFFLDNGSEWTAGRIASIRLYDTVLTATDVASIGNSTPVTPTTPVPAPAPALLMLVAPLLLLRRRAR